MKFILAFVCTHRILKRSAVISPDESESSSDIPTFVKAMKRLSVGLTMLVLVIFTGIFLWQQAKSRRENDALRLQIAQLESEKKVALLRAAKQRETQLEFAKPPAVEPTAIRTTADEKAPGSQQVILRPPRMFSVPAPSDPALAKQQLRVMNSPGIDMTFAAMYQQLGLTPEEQDKFRNIRLDSNERSSELFKKAAKDRVSRDPASLETVFDVVNDQAAAEYQAALLQVFGEKRTEAINSYESTLSVRHLVTQLERALASSDSKLGPAQSEQLIQTIVANARGAGGNVDFGAVNTNTLLSQAQAFLNPNQLIALKPLVDGRVERAVEQNTMKQLQSATAPTLSPKPPKK